VPTCELHSESSSAAPRIPPNLEIRRFLRRSAQAADKSTPQP
jgi:hypothetical protein